MHSPRPRGVSTIGAALTDKDSAAIESFTRKMTNFKSLSGIDSLKIVKALPDGGYVIIQNMGGTLRTIAHKPISDTPPTFDGLANPKIPMLFSGIFTRSVLYSRQGHKFARMKLTKQARRRIANYNPDENEWPPEEIELGRFNIQYSTRHKEFEPEEPFPGVSYLQHAQLRPGWFSGAMAEVVQIVSGYGVQFDDKGGDAYSGMLGGLAAEANKAHEEVDRAVLTIPSEVQQKIEVELKNARLPGYTGNPPKDGQIKYDYKFYDCHGVVFDSKNKPWLINISNTRSGVFVMPLPLIPATTTEAFREYIEEKDDQEILAILDRFGGMPSGESFPSTGKDFQAWVRAGVIIKVCDNSDFFYHSMYSSACGWSFSSDGAEAVNTCFDYSGTGFIEGYMYMLNITIDGKHDYLSLPGDWKLDDDSLRKSFNSYMSQLYQRLGGNDDESLAIKYKLRSIDAKEILKRNNGGKFDAGKEHDYWNNYEAEPIATCTGRLNQTNKGFLYHRAKSAFQPQIKFPEPFFDGCVSFDFTPTIESANRPRPKCDTPIFAFYVGSQLKTIKYFYDGTAKTKPTENNFEEHMIVGEWNQTQYLTTTGFSGCFYSNDLDDRVQLTERTKTTNIVGRDMGYGEPFFAYDGFFQMPGTLTRRKYYTHTVTDITESGRTADIGICIPYFNRDMALFANESHYSGRVKTVSTSMKSVGDPNSYRFFTYDFVMHWQGGVPKGEGFATNFEPYPKDSDPVYTVGHVYAPGGASDFADQGPWMGSPPEDITSIVHPQSNVWRLSGGGTPPPFTASSQTVDEGSKTTGNIKFIGIANPMTVHDRIPAGHYFSVSPDPLAGIVFYRDATQNKIGSAEYTNVSEAKFANNETRAYWGRCVLADHKSAHNFFGVINE